MAQDAQDDFRKRQMSETLATDLKLAKDLHAQELASLRRTDKEIARALAEEEEKNARQTDEELAKDLAEEESKQRQISDEQFAMDIYTRELAYVTQLKFDRKLAESLQKEANREAQNVSARPERDSFNQAMAAVQPPAMISDDNYEALLELGEQIGEAKESGLVKAQLDSLPTQVFKEDAKIATSQPSEDAQCSVCREDFAAGENLRMLPCLHRYHKQCIDAWLEMKAKCPICNLDIKEECNNNGQGNSM